MPSLVHACNSTRYESTGYAANHFMFGRHRRLAVDAFLATKQESESFDKSQYVSGLKK